MTATTAPRHRAPTLARRLIMRPNICEDSPSRSRPRLSWLPADVGAGVVLVGVEERDQEQLAAFGSAALSRPGLERTPAERRCDLAHRGYNLTERAR